MLKPGSVDPACGAGLSSTRWTSLQKSTYLVVPRSANPAMGQRLVVMDGNILVSVGFGSSKFEPKSKDWIKPKLIPSPKIFRSLTFLVEGFPTFEIEATPNHVETKIVKAT